MNKIDRCSFSDGQPLTDAVRLADCTPFGRTRRGDLPLSLSLAHGGTASIRQLAGFEMAAHVLGGFLLVAGLAACGLPGLSPFVSEMLVIIAAFDHAWWAGAVAVIAIVLAAIYALWMYQRTMTGPEPLVVPDLDRREVGVLAPLLLALVLFGFYPMPLLDVINPSVEDTLSQVDVTEDGPAVTEDAASTTEGGHE